MDLIESLAMNTSMFLPMLVGTLYRTVAYDGRGKPTYTNPVAMGYSPIRIKVDVDQTSIRTDKSASQGRADEKIFDGRILVGTAFEPKEGQAVRLKDGKIYKIEVVQEIYESSGDLDHYQLDLLL